MGKIQANCIQHIAKHHSQWVGESILIDSGKAKANCNIYKLLQGTLKRTNTPENNHSLRLSDPMSASFALGNIVCYFSIFHLRPLCTTVEV